LKGKPLLRLKPAQQKSFRSALRSTVPIFKVAMNRYGEATVSGARKCSLDSCPDPAVTSLAQRELCLHHFLSRCYEDLDRFDRRTRRSDPDHSGSAMLKAFVTTRTRGEPAMPRSGQSATRAPAGHSLMGGGAHAADQRCSLLRGL
jgi:hypothetical protein